MYFRAADFPRVLIQFARVFLGLPGRFGSLTMNRMRHLSLVEAGVP